MGCCPRAEEINAKARELILAATILNTEEPGMVDNINSSKCCGCGVTAPLFNIKGNSVSTSLCVGCVEKLRKIGKKEK